MNAPLLISCLLVAAIGAGLQAAKPTAAADPDWFVYRKANSAENHGFWTNVIPGGVDGALRVDLAAPVEGGGTAVRLDFDFARAPWSGIIVASAPDYWGAQPGPGFDLAASTALVFRARGAHGGERVRVKAAVAGDQPYGDSAPLPLDGGWITLAAGWQEFRIAASGRDLARVITPLMVIANDKHNPGGRITVFLDDIRWERGG